MKLLQAGLLAGALLAPVALLVGEVRAEKAASAGRVQFVKSLAEARNAAGDRKPILLNFHTRWCGYCKKMDRTTWRDPRVVARAERDLVLASFDAEDGGEGEKLARRFSIVEFPTVVLIDGRERELGRLRGYRKAEDLLAAVDRLLAGPDARPRG